MYCSWLCTVILQYTIAVDDQFVANFNDNHKGPKAKIYRRTILASLDTVEPEERHDEAVLNNLLKKNILKNPTFRNESQGLKGNLTYCIHWLKSEERQSTPDRTFLNLNSVENMTNFLKIISGRM
jgi:hypothetical protein